MTELSVKDGLFIMARPLSEEKRTALLIAAASAIAAQGTSVSTSSIAKAAGVADGSLFRYFPTKDDLLNQLYSWIKKEIAEAMLAGYPSGAELPERLKSVWMAYLRWGVQNPAKRQAMSQLSVSHRVTDTVRDESMKHLQEVSTLLKQCLGPENQNTAAFAAGIMTALSDVTIGFMASDRRKAAKYAEMGFHALVRALACNF